MAKFHELALLCHEHADRCKLPELDTEHSLQGTIERKMETKYADYQQRKARRARAAANKGEVQNPFLPGMSGDKLTQREQKYYDILLAQREQHVGTVANISVEDDDEGWFCLPCDVKDEVYQRPPSYRHVHTNQYDPNNRPAKIVTSGEVCQCVDFCGTFVRVYRFV